MYYDYYTAENAAFFRKVFREMTMGDTDFCNIAIIGGGNGWELAAIDEAAGYENNQRINCTIVDRCIWPKNDIRRNYAHIGSIHIQKMDMFDFLRDTDSVKKFDLLYFSRCINYTDLEQSGYINCGNYGDGAKSLFIGLKKMIADAGVFCVFAQIELRKIGHTRMLNELFKKEMGLGDYVHNLPYSHTRLYLYDPGCGSAS